MKTPKAVLRLIFVLSCFLQPLRMNGEVSEQRKAELPRALWKSGGEAIHTLTVEEKAWLLEYFRYRRRENGIESYSLERLQLGDEEEIKRTMKGYPILPPDAATLVGSRQPRLIEYIAPSFFINEPAVIPMKERDHTDPYPISTQAAFISLCLIAESWELPAEVQKWAQEQLKTEKNNGRHRSNESLRNVMRAWWKENKTAMHARKWADVKPGKTIPVIHFAQPQAPSNHSR